MPGIELQALVDEGTSCSCGRHAHEFGEKVLPCKFDRRPHRVGTSPALRDGWRTEAGPHIASQRADGGMGRLQLRAPCAIAILGLEDVLKEVQTEVQGVVGILGREGGRKGIKQLEEFGCAQSVCLCSEAVKRGVNYVSIRDDSFVMEPLEGQESAPAAPLNSLGLAFTSGEQCTPDGTPKRQLRGERRGERIQQVARLKDTEVRPCSYRTDELRLASD